MLILQSVFGGTNYANRDTTFGSLKFHYSHI